MSMPSSSSAPLGRVVRVYRPTSGQLASEAIFAFVCLLLFVWLLFVNVAIPVGNIELGFNVWIHVVLLVCIFYSAFGFYVHRGLSYVLYERGFTRTLLSKTETVRWSDIKRIDIEVTQERLFGPVPMPGSKTKTYKITLNTRKVIEFAGNSLRGARELGEEITRQWQNAVKAAAGSSAAPQQPMG
jgi:hypothetical protein